MGMPKVEELLQKVQAGDMEAAAHLAEGNLHGQFTGQPDDKAAYRYAKMAADAGNARACTVLGILYLEGRYTERMDAVGQDAAADYQKAEECFRRAEGLQDMKAPRFLGQLYAEGLGRKKDWMEAKHWYETGAQRGDISSMYMLGKICEEGHCGTTDLRQAVQWYQKAAVRKDHVGAPAREALKRLGVPEDE